MSFSSFNALSSQTTHTMASPLLPLAEVRQRLIGPPAPSPPCKPVLHPPNLNYPSLSLNRKKPTDEVPIILAVPLLGLYCSSSLLVRVWEVLYSYFKSLLILGGSKYHTVQYIQYNIVFSPHLLPQQIPLNDINLFPILWNP